MPWRASWRLTAWIFAPPCSGMSVRARATNSGPGDFLAPNDPALYLDRGVSLMLLKQYPPAVLERRILLQSDGDLDVARSDWLSVIETTSDSDEA